MKIDQFLRNKRHIQETTKENYGQHLRNLDAWLKVNEAEIGQLTCEGLLEYLQMNPWGNSMQRGSLYALRSYLRWDGQEDHPVLNVPQSDPLLPKLKPVNKRFLSKDDFDKLLAACDSCRSGMRERNRAILHLLWIVS